MPTSFSCSSLDLELNQSIVLMLVNIISPQAEIVDQSLSETMFVEGQFFRSSLTDCDEL